MHNRKPHPPCSTGNLSVKTEAIQNMILEGQWMNLQGVSEEVLMGLVKARVVQMTTKAV